MRRRQNISTSQIEACLRTYWLAGTFRVVGWRFRESEAPHLTKLYSAIVTAEISSPAPPRYLIAHLWKHSWRKPWQPASIECGDRVPTSRINSSFVNHQLFDHLPSKSEIEAFQILSDWPLDGTCRIVEDDEYAATA
jgi:hypothetical protein